MKIDMTFTKKVVKNGNSYCVYLPKKIIELLNKKAGDKITIEIKG